MSRRQRGQYEDGEQQVVLEFTRHDCYLQNLPNVKPAATQSSSNRRLKHSQRILL